MARFFKYKTPEALLADAEARGLDLRLSEDLSPLLRPHPLGRRTAGNRMAIQPMEGCDGNLDGTPGELTFRRYERFGAGGAKLIWMEATAVVPEGRANTRQLLLTEATAPEIARLLETCRGAHRRAFGDDSDLVVGLQLTHSGRYSVGRPVIAEHNPVLDPRTVLDKKTGERAGPGSPLISDEELERLADSYIDAAKRAAAIGFDFVDLKQCHGYLLNELLGARERPGRFGGALENRARFIRGLVARIRAEIPDCLIGTRINVFDALPFEMNGQGAPGVPAPWAGPYRTSWGTDIERPLSPDLAEPIGFIGDLAGDGVGLFNITLGNPYANPHFGRPFEYSPSDGYQSPEHPLIGVVRHFDLTARIQAAHPGLPLIGSGYSWLQAFAFAAGAANIRDGRTTFMGIGRAALSHPDFGRYVMEGKPLDPKRTCRTFSYCTGLMRSKHNELGQYPAGCPPFDKAVYGPIWDEAQETAPRPKA